MIVFFTISFSLTENVNNELSILEKLAVTIVTGLYLNDNIVRFMAIIYNIITIKLFFMSLRFNVFISLINRFYHI